MSSIEDFLRNLRESEQKAEQSAEELFGAQNAPDQPTAPLAAAGDVAPETAPTAAAATHRCANGHPCHCPDDVNGHSCQRVPEAEERD